jgi:hypothetical protein
MPWRNSRSKVRLALQGKQLLRHGQQLKEHLHHLVLKLTSHLLGKTYGTKG